MSCVCGFVCAGNIALTPEVFYLFLAYLSGFVFVVVCMFMRVEIIRFVIWMVCWVAFLIVYCGLYWMLLLLLLLLLLLVEI